MRILKEIPELVGSLESGELTLTNLSLVKQATEIAKKSTLEKRVLIEEVKGKSKRECEKILAREFPESIPSEGERVLTETHTEVRVVLNEGQLNKLNRLKGLLSHKNPDPTYAELIELLSDLALKKLDPMEQPQKKKELSQNESTSPAKSQTIPRPLRREVLRSANGKCARCGSGHLLEIDHITPRAKGGTNEPANLRALCRNCNQYEAVRRLGPALMEPHLPRLRN